MNSIKVRGLGTIYHPTYIDQATGQRKEVAVWWIRYSYRGRQHRENSHSTEQKEAIKLLKRRLGEMGKGRLLGPDVEKTTLKELTDMVVADYEVNGKRSIKRIRCAVAHLHEFFGADEKTIGITDDRVTAYKAHRQEQGAKNATVNRELAALKRAFHLGRRKVADIPTIEMLEEHNVRKGFFERDQFEAILKHLPADLQPAMHVAYLTGWRIPSEILTRQRRHLDLNAGWLRLDPQEAKNDEGRMFPVGKDVSPELYEVLHRQIGRTEQLEKATGRIIPWLFHRNGRPIKDFRTAWQKACAATGLEELKGRIPHDFRRTAVRNLERAGVPRSAAMAMTGHLTESVYRRYAIVDEQMLREGAAKLTSLRRARSRKSKKAKVVNLKTPAPK